ncbi:hypothetical protein OGATHE_004968 [Ogataea polymorpha]|uniref:Uncharacterized protein n=1 Tax=Ogataea polymorpha TaxID=460523 RepID=A0A9P8T0I2_9ASCO|nr:hypothetical protein OGATHE_004968 [Ogataea polymorpha]
MPERNSVGMRNAKTTLNGLTAMSLNFLDVCRFQMENSVSGVVSLRKTMAMTNTKAVMPVCTQKMILQDAHGDMAVMTLKTVPDRLMVDPVVLNSSAIICVAGMYAEDEYGPSDVAIAIMVMNSRFWFLEKRPYLASSSGDKTYSPSFGDSVVSVVGSFFGILTRTMWSF